MFEDADTAQARELLHSLYAHVDEISEKLEAAEEKSEQVHGRVERVVRRRAASLRRELYEAHRTHRWTALSLPGNATPTPLGSKECGIDLRSRKGRPLKRRSAALIVLCLRNIGSAGLGFIERVG
jgi:hypothetical protein